MLSDIVNEELTKVYCIVGALNGVSFSPPSFFSAAASTAVNAAVLFASVSVETRSSMSLTVAFVPLVKYWHCIKS